MSVDEDDRLAETLEVRRDFLLRSLADLDAEHAAGELTDDRYGALVDDYTVQAATVLEAIERLRARGVDRPPTDARPRTRRRIAWAAAVVAVLVLGATLLVRSLDDRQAGQTITGNSQARSADLDTLARMVKDRPDDAGVQIAYAQALLQASRPVDALRAFDTAARLAPEDPVPKAYGGWIVFLAGLTDQAMPRLDAAVAADPGYPDAHFFRGMVLLRGRDDRAGALAELREYMRLAPAGAEREQVQALIDELEQPSASTTTTLAPR